MKHLIALLLLWTCFSTPISAQTSNFKKSNIKFGDVKAEDFSPVSYAVDTSAAAVVLADIGSSKFGGNQKGGFSLSFKHLKRLRIMKKTAFNEGTISIYYFKSKDKEEKIEDFEAVTYNLENGKVVSTVLDKGSFFKEKLNSHVLVKKFTFPNLKEGSIIEFQYTITDNFILRGWNFQGELPRIWSEYTVNVPGSFDYVVTEQGSRPYDYKDSKITRQTFHVSEARNADIIGGTDNYSFDINVNTSSWGLQNIPGLKPEAYTSTIENYDQKIGFQLRSISWEEGKVENFMESWESFASKLLRDPDFGEGLSDRDNFNDPALNQLLKNAENDNAKAKIIYDYVRSNYSSSDHPDLWISKPLSQAMKDKSGNEADINLILTGFYRAYGLEADPVVLSTRDHGRVISTTPILDNFNYVITRVLVNGKYILLDASHSDMGFGKLSTNIYNDSARVINKSTIAIPLSAELLKEAKVTSVFITNDDNGSGFSGTYKSDLGYYESTDLRENIAGSSLKNYFKKIKASYPYDIKIENEAIDSLKRFDDPVSVNYEFSFTPQTDVLYFSPLMSDQITENPFKSARREYPVEMPYHIDEMYVLNMDVPKGYKIDEMPKPSQVSLNGTDGSFEYSIIAQGDKLQLRTRIIISKTTFQNEDYNSIRDFYAYIVKKEAEPIVFKKQK